MSTYPMPSVSSTWAGSLTNGSNNQRTQISRNRLRAVYGNCPTRTDEAGHKEKTMKRKISVARLFSQASTRGVIAHLSGGLPIVFASRAVLERWQDTWDEGNEWKRICFASAPYWLALGFSDPVPVQSKAALMLAFASR